MTLKDKIPEQFYALFRTKNRDYYMLFLVALYDENNDMYTSLGLTIEEAKQIVLEQMSHVQMEWQLEAIEHELTQEDRQDVSAEQESEGFAFTPSKIVNRLITWGWIKRDFDEKQNEYIISFTNGAPGGQTRSVMSYLTTKFVPGFTTNSEPPIGYGCALSLVTTVLFASISIVYNKINNKVNSMF